MGRHGQSPHAGSGYGIRISRDKRNRAVGIINNGSRHIIGSAVAEAWESGCIIIHLYGVDAVAGAERHRDESGRYGSVCGVESAGEVDERVDGI